MFTLYVFFQRQFFRVFYQISGRYVTLALEPRFRRFSDVLPGGGIFKLENSASSPETILVSPTFPMYSSQYFVCPYMAFFKTEKV
jgi:hypothetical protein